MKTQGFDKYDRMNMICGLCQECEKICYKKNNGSFSPADPIYTQ